MNTHGLTALLWLLLFYAGIALIVLLSGFVHRNKDRKLYQSQLGELEEAKIKFKKKVEDAHHQLILDKAQCDEELSLRNKNVNDELAQRAEDFEKQAQEKKDLLTLEREEFENFVAGQIGILKERETAIEHLADEKTQGFPWFAEAYAEFKFLQAERTAWILENKRYHALKAADEVRQIARDKRITDTRAKQLEYLVKYYESLVPSLREVEENDIDDIVSDLSSAFDDGDPASKWLSTDEYRLLPSQERNQLALNNYWKRKKSSWMLGRDYERYVGYLFEAKGYQVEYHGIEKGLRDLGRDLVARHPKTGDVCIVQCKYWRKDKEIDIKHLYQLFGTLIHYRLNREATRELSLFDKEQVIRAQFWTSATLRADAKEAAKYLGVEIIEGKPLDTSYPCIKCNYSYSTDQRIYHLPFDQQYDRTKIEDERFECYSSTVKEAEVKGYRRAYRWHASE